MVTDEHSINIEEEVHIAYDAVKLEEKIGIIDVVDQFVDGERVHEREEYLIKNEEINSNCLLAELNANHLLSSSTKEMPEDPLINNENNTQDRL
ncbi:uncharacterized protein LOC123307499 isoform X3 [Coccinella septempunctata]|uniref:uncharacterized protein LOC123307499 isoform X3 n=1 Tax=Coccinella septempunctata TaxID=41139 RepID=UPI001D083D99|nr:uncharacterized protein LOC123307499 isoform X3 [Coccinella septempunctata]